MQFHFSPGQTFDYILRREANQLFVSMAIRCLAIGMIALFEPIYIFHYFRDSLPLTSLFFGGMYGIFAILAVFGGKIMGKVGMRSAILIGHTFLWGYFLSLFFLYDFPWLIPLAMVLKASGLLLFWIPFHTEFMRFSEDGYQGKAVGKLNIAMIIPNIISPIIGGWILASFGYPVLFITVLIVLFASAIPLFAAKEKREIYSDSYYEAWKRVFRRKNWKITLSTAASGIEQVVAAYLWPIFMVILAISYTSMGGLTTAAIAVSVLFNLYMGKMSDTISNRVWFLNIGAILTSIAWIIKYFVITPFDAFLAHTLYKICRTSVAVPFQTFTYKRASMRGKEADEFIVYREIVLNIARFLFLMILAGVFCFYPKINAAFFAAAAVSLLFVFMGVRPKFHW